MNIRYALLALIFAATPALARTYSSHSNGKDIGCIPSSDPSVPPCGVKDEAPTYFPNKLTPADTAKPTTPAAPAASGTKTKHKKPKQVAPIADAPEEDGWEKAGDAQTH